MIYEHKRNLSSICESYKDRSVRILYTFSNFLIYRTIPKTIKGDIYLWINYIL